MAFRWMLMLVGCLWVLGTAVQANDSQRPAFHPLPPSLWINDPNGPIFLNDTHHLFFQYNPNAAVWGDIHWGHMSSADLVHWKWEGVALSPDSNPLGADHSGCWTGSAVVDVTAAEPRAAILYTGVRTQRLEHQRQLLAYGTEGLRQWERAAENPVIAGPPVGEIGAVNGFRDPAFWYDEEEELWRLLIGSGQDGVGGMILHYTSTAGLEGPFNFESVLIQGRVANGSDSWECPDMFQLTYEDISVWVLLFGNNGPGNQRCFYMLGTVDTQFLHFSPLPGYEEGVLLDAGDYYAAKTSAFAGQRLLWGWVKEARQEAAYAAAGWAGAQALPRSLGLASATGPLTFTVAPELSILQLNATAGSTRLNDTAVQVLGGSQLLLSVNFSLSIDIGGIVGVEVLASDQERTVISHTLGSGELIVNRTESSSAPWNNRSTQSIPIAVSGGLELLVLVDHSVVEVIAQGSFAITSRVYPEQESSTGVRLFASDTSAIAQYSVEVLDGIY